VSSDQSSGGDPRDPFEAADAELARGSDGARREPCDGCGTADEPSLISPEGVDVLLCDDCLRSCAEAAEVLDRGA
jgi:hypothetical protein